MCTKTDLRSLLKKWCVHSMIFFFCLIIGHVVSLSQSQCIFLILGRLCAVSILPHFKATLNSFNFDLVSRGMSTSLVEKLKTEFVHHCTMFSKSDLKLVLILTYFCIVWPTQLFSWKAEFDFHDCIVYLELSIFLYWFEVPFSWA